MTDISNRVEDALERTVTHQAYALECKHFIPFLGLKTYKDTFPAVSIDSHFLDGFNESQKRDIRSRRLNRGLLLECYEGLLIGGIIFLGYLT